MRFLITAVTRLGKGICVAGVKMDPKSKRGEWIRPTRITQCSSSTRREWRGLERSDLYDEHGRLITRVGNIVDWEILEPLPPLGPHVEDVHHPVGGKKTFVSSLEHSLLLSVYGSLSQDRVQYRDFIAERVSFTVIRPSQVRHIYMDTTNVTGRSQPKIAFSFQGSDFCLPVTDLEWVRLCQACYKRKMFSHADYSRFLEVFDLSLEYLVLGSGQEYKGKYYKFIIGVVCGKPLAKTLERFAVVI